jgi:HAMP domain-containing protein
VLKRSIRARLNVAFIFVALVPLLIVGLVLTLRSFAVLYQQAIFFENAVAQRVSTQVDEFIKRLAGELSLAANELPGKTLEEQAALLSYLPSYPITFQTLVVTDASGGEALRLSRLEVVSDADKQDWANTNEFLVPRDSKSIYYGPIQFDAVYGDPSMTIAVPVINVRTGAIDNVVIANVRFKPIWDLLGNINLNAGENVFIVDVNSRVIAHRNPSVVLAGRTFNVPSEPGFFNGLDFANAILASTAIDLGSQRFVVVAERQVSNALELAIQTALITSVLMVGALILASALGFRTAKQFSQPLTRLAEAAQALSVKSDDFDAKKIAEETKRQDEFGQLARVFENMGKQVVTREQDLKRQVLELKIEIDESKKQASIAQIVDSEYFRDLEQRVGQIRRTRKEGGTGNRKTAEAPNPEGSTSTSSAVDSSKPTT